MATVLLLHSIRGLRAVEKSAADRLRAAGHDVTTPDLFDGAVPETLEAGFALEERLGIDTIVDRAEAAAADLPPQTVLAGLSLGAFAASLLWPRRPRTSGLLLLHGIGMIPAAPRAGTQVQVHLAEPDPFDSEADVAEWQDLAARRQVAAEVHRYPGPGHLFTDSAIEDHDAAAAALLWSRVTAFLDRL